MTQDSIVIAGKAYTSRLLVGTGKYKDEAEAIVSIEASGAEIVTVAVRRIDLQNDKDSSILDYISPDKYTICLLYTSPSPRDISGSRMPSSA